MQTRVTAWAVLPEGETLFSALATTVSIQDDGAGEFVVVAQSENEGSGEIRIDPDEWQALRDAIDAAACACRK